MKNDLFDAFIKSIGSLSRVEGTLCMGYIGLTNNVISSNCGKIQANQLHVLTEAVARLVSGSKQEVPFYLPVGDGANVRFSEETQRSATG